MRAVYNWIDQTMHKFRTIAAVPVEKRRYRIPGKDANTGSASVRPRCGSAITSRQRRARSAVRSVLPLSTTMMSRGIPVTATARTTSVIGSSSLSAGIMTLTRLIQHWQRSSQNDPGAREVKHKRKEIGERERNRSGGNLGIQF